MSIQFSSFCCSLDGASMAASSSVPSRRNAAAFSKTGAILDSTSSALFAPSEALPSLRFKAASRGLYSEQTASAFAMYSAFVGAATVVLLVEVEVEPVEEPVEEPLEEPLEEPVEDLASFPSPPPHPASAIAKATTDVKTARFTREAYATRPHVA